MVYQWTYQIPFFYNNSVLAITMDTGTKCLKTSIVFTNITIYKTFGNPDHALYIYNENTILSVTFKNVNFISNNLTHMLFIYNNVIACNQSVSIQLTGCTFKENFALDHVVALDIIANQDTHYPVTIELYDCTFDNNFGGENIVYVNVPSGASTGSMILDNSTFSNNKGTALYLTISELRYEGNVLFVKQFSQ